MISCMWATMDDSFARDVSEVRARLLAPSSPTLTSCTCPTSGRSKLANGHSHHLHPLGDVGALSAQVLAHYQVDLEHGMTLDQVEKVRVTPHSACAVPREEPSPQATEVQLSCSCA